MRDRRSSSRALKESDKITLWTATDPFSTQARQAWQPWRRLFFHIEMRPSAQFVAFRVQDVGAPGGVERVAGQHASGSWDTAKWPVEKTHAHIEDDRLVPDSVEAKKPFKSLGSATIHVDGDRFRAKPRRDIPEAAKPTPAMRRPQLANIKKAQAAVRGRRKRLTR